MGEEGFLFFCFFTKGGCLSCDHGPVQVVILRGLAATLNLNRYRLESKQVPKDVRFSSSCRMLALHPRGSVDLTSWAGFGLGITSPTATGYGKSATPSKGHASTRQQAQQHRHRHRRNRAAKRDRSCCASANDDENPS
jgi:hypothetical protein